MADETFLRSCDTQSCLTNLPKMNANPDLEFGNVLESTDGELKAILNCSIVLIEHIDTSYSLNLL